MFKQGGTPRGGRVFPVRLCIDMEGRGGSTLVECDPFMPWLHGPPLYSVSLVPRLRRSTCGSQAGHFPQG